MEDAIYFDNAATSWPKPKQVLHAMKNYLEEIGGSPGRSGHRMSISASRLIEETRETVGKIFHFHDTSRIVFTKNVTEALNICIFSLLQPGDHVITSSTEHNSVMRPLRHLEKMGVSLSIVKCNSDGAVNHEAIVKELKRNTKLVILTHASNVTGTILPVREVASTCKERKIPLLVDCAQTAGAIPMDLELDKYDNCIMAFTGHKSLFGPTGTGGMCIGNSITLSPLICGGTGSKSDKDTQPDFLPDQLESGTINVLGLAGLKAGIEFLLKEGLSMIRKHEKKLIETFLNGAIHINGLKIYGTKNIEKQTGIVSFNIENISPSIIGLILDRKYSIMCRIGLHCNPNAHKTSGTFPDGTIRFSFSYFNTIEQIEKSITALKEISMGKLD
jgi:cysteine desulfurase family protein